MSVARQVSHPNVCRVYDIGEVDGHLFLSMEYIEGEDLAAVLGPLLDYDARRGSDLVGTLAAYFAAGASPRRAAGALHVHVNTVGQRLDRVAALLASVGIPATLADLGLPADQLRWTAEQAVGAERLVANNPRALDVDSLERIVRAAHAGDRAALRDTPGSTTAELATTAGAR